MAGSACCCDRVAAFPLSVSEALASDPICSLASALALLSPYGRLLSQSLVAASSQSRMDSNLEEPLHVQAEPQPRVRCTCQASTGTSGYELHISNARVTPDPEKICSKEWLKHQAYTINWTNLALIFTVVGLSWTIQGTLNSQRHENAVALSALIELNKNMPVALDAVGWLKNGTDLLNRYHNVTAYATQLDEAQQEIAQLKQQVAKLSARSWLHLATATTAATTVVPLTLVQQGGSTSAIEVSPSGYSIIVREAGSYLVCAWLARQRPLQWLDQSQHQHHLWAGRRSVGHDM